MMGMEWLWTGAAITGIVAAWGYIKGIINQITGLLFVSAGYGYYVSDAMLVYLQRNGHQLWSSQWRYNGQYRHIPSRDQHELVVTKTAGSIASFYWLHGRLFLVQELAQQTGDSTERFLSLTSLRGVDFDDLVRKATKNSLLQDDDDRFAVHDFYGTLGKAVYAMQNGENPRSIRAARYDSERHEMQHWNLVTHDLADLVSKGRRSSLADFAMFPAAEDLLRQVQSWLEDKDWYESRGVPWKLGVMLTGKPGTGKSTLSLGIAKNFNLPLGVLHIGTMSDQEFEDAWRSLGSLAPCVALIEDLDATFDKRVNLKQVAHGTPLDFSTLLNAIDGVNSPPGVLLIVTTNHPEKLDAALTASGEVSRPGRIDYVYEFGNLPESARRSIADRILCDLPEEEREALVQEHQEVTGALFQLRCRERAHEWRHRRRISACVRGLQPGATV